MTEQEINEFNAREEFIYTSSLEKTEKILNELSKVITADQAEAMVYIIKSGNQKEIDTLIEGLVKLYG